MSKHDLTSLSEELITAITRLAAALEGYQTNAVKESAFVQHEEKVPRDERQVTLEQIRAVLAAKSKSGSQAQIKDLITKYGANKLTEIDPSRFTHLLKEAEGL